MRFGDIDERPVTIVAGTLGRRIAAMFAAGGTDVRIVDLSEDQREAARDFVTENASEIRQRLRLAAAHLGAVDASPDLAAAVRGAWMVIEAVPEKLDLKRQVVGELDRIADADAIIGSNSSSLPSSSFIDKVEHPERVLNTHYQMPPDLNAVELMSDGTTDESLIEAPLMGTAPVRVRSIPRSAERRIHPQLDRASIKRECLMVVEEGVASPQDARPWRSSPPPAPPVPATGWLDVVLDIEEHYALVRPASRRGRACCYASTSNRDGRARAHGFYDHAGRAARPQVLPAKWRPVRATAMACRMAFLSGAVILRCAEGSARQTGSERR
jgi:3-hydroxybutyryl-CoA dehydrogenase